MRKLRLVAILLFVLLHRVVCFLGCRFFRMMSAKEKKKENEGNELLHDLYHFLADFGTVETKKSKIGNEIQLEILIPNISYRSLTSTHRINEYCSLVHLDPKCFIQKNSFFCKWFCVRLTELLILFIRFHFRKIWFSSSSRFYLSPSFSLTHAQRTTHFAYIFELDFLLLFIESNW